MQDDPFFQKWFGGVQQFLNNAPKEATDSFLSFCAKGCSKSYSLAVYQNAFMPEHTLEEAMTLLANSFEDFHYDITENYIEIRYSSCGCDLYKSELIRSSQLCRCSELSLAYNWESIFGKDNIQVERKSSILHGDKECIFHVRVRQLGHMS